MRILQILLVVLTVLSVPSRTPASTAPASAHSAAVHAGSVSDAQIQQTIQTRLAKSKIGKDGFRFHVSHGVVTWEGTTGVVQHKGSATRMAKAAGATQVVNNIQVSAAAKAKAAQSLHKASVSEN
jgi:BON domain